MTEEAVKKMPFPHEDCECESRAFKEEGVCHCDFLPGGSFEDPDPPPPVSAGPRSPLSVNCVGQSFLDGLAAYRYSVTSCHHLGILSFLLSFVLLSVVQSLLTRAR
jgi:hypothetical protein